MEAIKQLEKIVETKGITCPVLPTADNTFDCEDCVIKRECGNTKVYLKDYQRLALAKRKLTELKKIELWKNLKS